MGNCNKVFTLENKIQPKSLTQTNGSNRPESNDSFVVSYINNLTPKKIKKIFIQYNILDLDKNIIVGIWDNPQNQIRTVNQYLWIGEKNKIYKLICGLRLHNIVILHYGQQIVLKIEKQINKTTNACDFVIELKNNTNTPNYTSVISEKVIGKLKKINNNSPDIDLIFNIIPIDV